MRATTRLPSTGKAPLNYIVPIATAPFQAGKGAKALYVNAVEDFVTVASATKHYHFAAPEDVKRAVYQRVMRCCGLEFNHVLRAAQNIVTANVAGRKISGDR